MIASSPNPPFGLSLSKPCPFLPKEIRPFDKLRANGCDELQR